VRICIVTSDFVGPIRNGGIGTAYYGLALALAQGGHEVTVLYVLGDYCENQDIRHWQDRCRCLGVEFVPMPRLERLTFDGPWCQQTAYSVYEWLKPRTYDVVHFHEWRGHGYHALLAKRQGLAFTNTLLCVGTHSPYLWHKISDGVFVDTLEDIEFDFLERQSVALADVVISPSAYLVEWMKGQGWDLPRNVIVRQNVLPNVPSAPVHAHKAHVVKELVFFGRLEVRKGLLTFCDALDRLAGQGLDAELRVTFLGKSSTVAGRDSMEFLETRATAWPFSWSVIQDRDQAGAREYLQAPGRLAVVPSIVENSPYTVLECLGHGIPFIASDTGGIPELVGAEDRSRVLFHPTPRELAAKLGETLGREFLPARPAASPDAVRREWIEWHDSLRQPTREATRTESKATPLVSVCLVHFNRPRYLHQAVQSLRTQDYPHIEVVLVDDGSTDTEAIALLDELEPEFESHGWRIVRQENRYLGAARNTAARHARGEYLLFMDDDNVAKPHQISTFVRAAQASGADILTCFMDVFGGDEPPADGNPQVMRWLPLGGAGAVGLFWNCFGDANGLIKREVFASLGGLTEDYGLGHEDWEFYAKAVLNGFRLQVVPEPLFWYRASQQGMLRNTSFVANHMRSIRPYLDRLPGDLRGLALFAQGFYFKAQSFESPETPQPEMPPAAVAGSASFQSLVDHYWDSTSWRVTGPLRKLVRRIEGLGKERRPQVRSGAEAMQVVGMIRNSIYWEVTGPLRAVGRIVLKLRGRWQRGPRR
jgi:GT2 family glycosyltransferase/glycosyltransferase involved in cell wall biosynthesis